MKYSVLVILLLFSSIGSADVYQYCQTQIEIVKNLSKLSSEELIKKKSEVAKSDSIESLTKATGTDYPSMISMLSKENVAEDKANLFVMKGMKAFEMRNISLAINIKELPREPDDYFWNQAFDMCVKGNRDQFE
ncbi:hypothetical protein AUP74_02435 [Microbulbifer aggregans]|uniref:Uncharacterized protein n=1 Tax=Microbulbifer aggregans TaxID=1769779 RepID=A0A1C9W9J5_9GAMM|nr:hypothetical protein [Microbulbifer aggregans]AOS97837.1 hypothetical protein AUP74_02435 [Microbulbifer aggregans]